MEDKGVDRIMGKQSKCLSLLYVWQRQQRGTLEIEQKNCFNLTKKDDVGMQSLHSSQGKTKKQKMGSFVHTHSLSPILPSRTMNKIYGSTFPPLTFFGFLLLPFLLCLLIESDGFTYVCVKKRRLLYCLGSLGSDQTWGWVNETPTEAETSLTFWSSQSVSCCSWWLLQQTTQLNIVLIVLFTWGTTP